MDDPVLFLYIYLNYWPCNLVGSLLVAAAHHGAFVTGTDIDHNLIFGRGKSYFSNPYMQLYRASLVCCTLFY